MSSAQSASHSLAIAKLTQIADSYKRAFRQESVLLLQVPGVRARF